MSNETTLNEALKQINCIKAFQTCRSIFRIKDPQLIGTVWKSTPGMGVFLENFQTPFILSFPSKNKCQTLNSKLKIVKQVFGHQNWGKNISFNSFLALTKIKLKLATFKVTFWIWGPVTIWHNMTSVQFFSAKKSIHPTDLCDLGQGQIWRGCREWHLSRCCSRGQPDPGHQPGSGSPACTATGPTLNQHT